MPGSQPSDLPKAPGAQPEVPMPPKGIVITGQAPGEPAPDVSPAMPEDGSLAASPEAPAESTDQLFQELADLQDKESLMAYSDMTVAGPEESRPIGAMQELGARGVYGLGRNIDESMDLFQKFVGDKFETKIKYGVCRL